MAIPNASAAANANPTGCHYEVPSGKWGGVARCDKSNGGHYRALVLCKDPDTGALKEFVGDWRTTGWSKAYCGITGTASSAGIETKYN
ncbi:hypothetical protein SALBM311S_03182 [Streptomyces alboniger]